MALAVWQPAAGRAVDLAGASESARWPRRTRRRGYPRSPPPQPPPGTSPPVNRLRSTRKTRPAPEPVAGWAGALRAAAGAVRTSTETCLVSDLQLERIIPTEVPRSVIEALPR